MRVLQYYVKYNEVDSDNTDICRGQKKEEKRRKGGEEGRENQHL